MEGTGKHEWIDVIVGKWKKMNKEEILCWKHLYDAEEDLYNAGLEERLREKFQRNGFATKEDLKKIIEWKFQGQLKGRWSLNLKRLSNFNPKLIEDLSKLAFTTDSDKTRLKLLTVIDGIGYSIATVILTFFDPQNYGVLDFHAWNAIFQDGKKTFGEKELIEFIDTQVIDSLVYELYFKEKFEEDGLKTNLLGLVESYLKDIENLETDEEKLEVIKGVVKGFKSDEIIMSEKEKIKSHEWVEIIESE